MAFPNDLYIASAYSGDVYKYVNDEIEPSATVNIGGTLKPQAVFVAQDQRTVYVANRENNSVTVIHDGVNEGYIAVGDEPYSMCEDSFGAIYVTCYASSKVYKIERTLADTTTITDIISVDAGPTGICCDSNNTVWVSCSVRGTVNKIVNNTVVLKIPCADNTVDNSVCRPMGICCDRANNIWVANYGSGTVIKITNSIKILTIDCVNGPYDVITDSNNNLYVCSYLQDVVEYYPSGSNTSTPVTINLPPGTGATAFGLNKDNDIYVVGSMSNQIFKIRKQEVVMTKTTLNISPAGFGDPTGCKAYNTFSRSTDPSQTLTPAASAIQLMSAIKLTFKVVGLTETLANTTFVLDSDVVKFSGFDHLKLNGVTTSNPNAQGYISASLPNAPAITNLELVGYYDSAETESVTFIPIDYSKIFKIVVGSIDDDGLGNYAFTAGSTPYVISNVDDQCNTLILETVLDGSLCVLIPERVAADVEKGLVVNGMQIYQDWEVGASELPDVTTSLAGSYSGYKPYINPYPAYAGTSVILNRYKL